MVIAADVERPGGRRRQRPQRRPERQLLRLRERAADLGDRGGQDDQRRDLGDERLRRRDGDLGPGLQEEDRVGLAGDRRPDGVGDRDDRAATLAGEAGRGDGVGGLARLGDRDDERPLVERRRAVAELGADVGPGRQPGPVLDRGRPDERRVVGAAAGDQLDARDRPQRLLEAGELVDVDPVEPVDASGDRLAERFGLLVDLLEHEMLVAALLGRLGRPVDGRHRALERLAGDVGDGHAPRPDVGDVAVLEEDDLVGVGEDRGHVRGEEALAVAEADDERHVLAGADQAIALADVHDDDRVGAFELAQRVPHGVGEVALVGLLDEVGDRLGVGLGGQGVAARLQPVAQLAEVLDDPVVDDRDLAGAVAVRVGVEVVRAGRASPSACGRGRWRRAASGRRSRSGG